MTEISSSACLVLVACSGRKSAHIDSARNLYRGELFKSSVAYAERAGLPWAVLSARHGVVMPDDRIAPYEQRMSSRRPEQQAWAARVAAQLEPLLPKELIFLAGSDYRRYLTAWCGEHAISWQAPLAGLPIGKQLFTIKLMWRTLHVLV